MNRKLNLPDYKSDDVISFSTTQIAKRTTDVSVRPAPIVTPTTSKRTSKRPCAHVPTRRHKSPQRAFNRCLNGNPEWRTTNLTKFVADFKHDGSTSEPLIPTDCRRQRHTSATPLTTTSVDVSSVSWASGRTLNPKRLKTMNLPIIKVL